MIMAEGTLVLNGNTIENPSGCYNSEQWPMRVNNQTDTGAAIYNIADCKGEITDTVQPGNQGVFEFGASVSFPCAPVT
jgi:hypothetical protein